MPFIHNIEGLRSLAIVGTAKNTGKTETLNYLLRRIPEEYPQLKLGITSIGIDGEKRDQVTETDKPEIVLKRGMIFATAEQFFRLKRLPVEILEVERDLTTSIGKLILSEARGKGKVLLAGPPSNSGIREMIKRMNKWGSELCIIDGALARLSLASPSVADGMILATGAAYSAQPELLIQRTKELYALTQLPSLHDHALALKLEGEEEGIRVIDKEGRVSNPGFRSALLPKMWEDTGWLSGCDTIFIPGVIHDNLLDRLRLVKHLRCLVVKDFTRVFASGAMIRKYLGSGKELICLDETRVVAVTFNPQAPSGYRLNSDEMCARLHEAIGVPVYDVRRV